MEDKVKCMSRDTAVVIGYKGTNSTGLIRSLGEAGFDVVFASSYSRIESKYTTKYWWLPENEDERAKVLCEYLKALPAKPALFTGDDTSNLFIEKYYESLSQYCYCPNTHGKLHTISDKTLMAQIAQKVGLNIPRTTMIDVTNVSECPLDFPVILKPYAGYAGRKTDIQICRNETEFDSSVRYLADNEYTKVVLQQLLDGENLQDLCLMGCSLEDGSVRIPCIIRKIRSYPLKQGSLSFGRVENSIPGLDVLRLKEFVKETGYVGIFDIDMMTSDGVPYFIEINYRNGQNGYVATAAGYNIPANWFKGMQGEPMEEENTVRELYYMDEHCDHKHVFDGNLKFSQWFKDLRKTSVFAMYHSGDQRPFIRQYVRFPERWKMKKKQQ